MTRLSESHLSKLDHGLQQSRYDRTQKCGVVHLGIGAFHRAHQADFFDQLMELGETGWMIQGASLRRPVAAEQLNPQDGLFTLGVRSSEGISRRIVRSIRSVLVAPDDPPALITALSDPSIALVTLTITEKGYCLDPASGALLTTDPDVQWDIENPDAPRTAPGFIVAGLANRKRAGIAPYAVLSCDNVPENGKRSRNAVIQLARYRDPALADWIARAASFPCSMVDRIVPATTQEDIVENSTDLGFVDEAMVKTEPFSQWVIEDKFCNRRPSLDRVGVQFTEDVAPYEKAKLRLLNAAHSAMAYLGSLAGFKYVHEVMEGEGFEALIDAIWDEVLVTLDPISGFNIDEYRAALKQRFRNTALEHQTRQIAIDGSQKIPQRFLNTIRERRARGLMSPALSLAVAGWVRWQLGEDENGQPRNVDDPMADQTQRISEVNRESPSAWVQAITALEPVFGVDLKGDKTFMAELELALSSLLTSGAAQAIREIKR